MSSENTRQDGAIRKPSDQEADATMPQRPIDGWPKDQWGYPIKQRRTGNDKPQTGWR